MPALSKLRNVNESFLIKADINTFEKSFLNYTISKFKYFYVKLLARASIVDYFIYVLHIFLLLRITLT